MGLWAYSAGDYAEVVKWDMLCAAYRRGLKPNRVRHHCHDLIHGQIA